MDMEGRSCLALKPHSAGSATLLLSPPGLTRGPRGGALPDACVSAALDCRVKPGNDKEGEARPRIQTRTLPGRTAPLTRRLLFLVTEDWYFWSHRLPQARAARDAGFEVLVATRVNAHGPRIEAEGFRLIPLPWSREGGFAHQLATVRVLTRLYRREQP